MANGIKIDPDDVAALAPGSAGVLVHFDEYTNDLSSQPTIANMVDAIAARLAALDRIPSPLRIDVPREDAHGRVSWK